MCCDVMVGKRKEKKEKEAFIFTLITLFRFEQWVCGFRTISWGCKTGCPSPILGWFDPCHGQSLVGRKVFSEFFQRFGYHWVGIVVMDIENFYLKMEILRVILGLLESNFGPFKE